MIPTQQISVFSITDLPARATQIAQGKLNLSGKNNFCRDGSILAFRQIKNNADAPNVCPLACRVRFDGGTWTGSWTQNADGISSVCGCIRFSPCE